MRLTIAYSKIQERNLVLIYNATYQRDTLSERPIRQPLTAQFRNEGPLSFDFPVSFLTQVLGEIMNLV